MRKLLTILGLALLTAALAAPAMAKDARPGRCTWTTGFFNEALVSRGLEELGFDVAKAKDLQNPIFYQSVALGDVDYWANGWFPMHNAQLPSNFHEKAELVGYLVKNGGLGGYLVSKKAVEKFNIKDLNDFKRPEVKEAFDSNGDGKADLVACPPGWGCEKVMSYHMKAYDLEDHVNMIQAGYSASMADAVARHQAGENVFFYTWTPNWTIYKLRPGEDVMWVNVPEAKLAPPQEGAKVEDLVASGIEGAVSDPLKMGFVASDIRITANKEFLEENPEARRFFELVKIPLGDIAAQNVKMSNGEDSQRDIERHVDEWIENNQETWDGWIAEAKKAAK
ncbi:glycine betaine/L-proline ABC transporter substrate-binding protein ProX [Desulfohalovibrio reitneri]|uniref:glycine betaine/L-proline ABC transporter substrate-binding protein ProX n=1 Tax=Desulfohalovibrio reitneri TaxID=1307759 RepID=UPI0004A6D29B|nr:glycine betaine/L-proline ABC transporter substrate-binding protein ProX [Desulfohalovibrio reitneri]